MIKILKDDYFIVISESYVYLRNYANRIIKSADISLFSENYNSTSKYYENIVKYIKSFIMGGIKNEVSLRTYKSSSLCY